MQTRAKKHCSHIPNLSNREIIYMERIYIEIMLKAPRIMLEPLRIIAKAPRIMVKAPRIMIALPICLFIRHEYSLPTRKQCTVVGRNTPKRSRFHLPYIYIYIYIYIYTYIHKD